MNGHDITSQHFGEKESSDELIDALKLCRPILW